MDRRMVPMRLRSKIIRRIAGLITRLLDHQVLKGAVADMTEHEIMDVCLLVPDALMTETSVIKLQSDNPIMVVGDIFGQYGHLVRLFNNYGHPPEQKYLFLGNYINQGPRSIETIALLFAYKVKYPKDIFLLRGKHECERLAEIYGLYDECVKRFSRRIFHAIVQVFPYLPCVAIVDNRIFCVHSGLSPMFSQYDVTGIKALRKFIRKHITLPSESSTNRLISHLVWSDPEESIDLWDQNPVGLGYLYGAKAVEEFCERFEIQQIIRSSDVIQSGYEFFTCPKLLTVFSAPDYMDIYENDACLVFLFRMYKHSEIRGQLNVVSPIIRLRNKPTMRMNVSLSSFPIEFGSGIRLARIFLCSLQHLGYSNSSFLPFVAVACLFGSTQCLSTILRVTERSPKYSAWIPSFDLFILPAKERWDLS
ncbi:hypothetical protein T265_00446 [Opisthorchis viverrini]|uniref:protein-serine/threonine phosphatase n=2 Tax=Opisthorchis viverrini TaxID=6198 RepID=A0A075AJQ0_OPIVI|nr:hypothetical protein T265_00446 [Opisthorchis viverrini]KER33769.1 hypothetical protein T265_00446 [Opisthorchis viverrini]